MDVEGGGNDLYVGIILLFTSRDWGRPWTTL